MSRRSYFLFYRPGDPRALHSFPTRRSSDLTVQLERAPAPPAAAATAQARPGPGAETKQRFRTDRSEEHTSELQSQSNLVCRLLLEKKKKDRGIHLRALEHYRHAHRPRDDVL